MADWKHTLNKLGYRGEEYFGAMKLRLKNRLGWLKPLQIVPFRGYGNDHSSFIQGRVLSDRSIRTATDDDRLWNNMAAAYRRFASDEIPNALVRAQFKNKIIETVTDEEGYFRFHFDVAADSAEKCLWHQVDIELAESKYHRQGVVEVTGEVLIPAEDCDFGIISDIDDTVIYTYSTSLIKMARLVFLKNARSRLPFAGASTFYRALHRGVSGESCNPIFYISRSPWNLYDLLIDFLDLNDFPAGPLLLRDFGYGRNQVPRKVHKRLQIDQVLNFYPKLKFVLIGDSGQDDAALYAEVTDAFPGKVLMVIIRDVSEGGRDEEIKSLAEKLAQRHVPLEIARDSVHAAEMAAELKLMREEAVKEVEADTKSKIKIEDL